MSSLPYLTQNKTVRILEDAERHGYNVEHILGVVKAAENKRSPLIIQVFPWQVKFSDGLLVRTAADAASRSSVPIAIHLDHCQDEALVKLAADTLPFDSIMVDMSHHGKAENLAKTKELVSYCHARGIATEAEPGRIEGGEDGVADTADMEGVLTTPEEVEEFIATGVDFLAPAIGLRKSEKQANGRVRIVLHGTNGFPDDVTRACITKGVSKINVNKLVLEDWNTHMRENASQMLLTQFMEEGVKHVVAMQEHQMDTRMSNVSLRQFFSPPEMANVIFCSPAILLCAAMLYLALVRTLRYKRSNAVKREYPTRESYRNMTLEEAWTIQSSLAEVEFPTVFSSSIFFALFRVFLAIDQVGYRLTHHQTYGIPSVSRLLAATGKLTNVRTASKWAADTGVILTEVLLHHPSDPRAIDGIARMNFLHERYRRTGKISDEDMLYTLSLFVLEPIRWTKRFDWREVNEVERCAMGTYWRWLGEAMDIPYTALRSNDSGWANGLHFLDELEEWSLGYEVGNMVSAETNKAVAKHTVDIALFNIPKALHALSFDLVSCLLEPRLRTAIMFERPSLLASLAVKVIVALRKLLVRHFFLPRPYFLRKRWFSDELNADGRFNFEQYIAHPWYIRPTLYNRWSLNSWLIRMVGGSVPGDQGAKYCPKGYIITELGPDDMRGKGEHDMQATRDRLSRNGRIDCPFDRW
ncbi:hypothetical protein LTR56_015449 [Elasticomyces elasticus]|nr:hypothetical protein LTR56_015449 [Elasticomyces elasticus]KAK4904048.1 hypothetical protein LTR49_026422 [Elasticomyces elasticus]KAK5761786.1 hypothetical protein LTS12_008041 [Elasticomyces elasticus]